MNNQILLFNNLLLLVFHLFNIRYNDFISQFLFYTINQILLFNDLLLLVFHNFNTKYNGFIYKKKKKNFFILLIKYFYLIKY